MDLYYKFNTFSAMFLFNNNYIDSYIELTLNIIISLHFCPQYPLAPLCDLRQCRYHTHKL